MIKYLFLYLILVGSLNSQELHINNSHVSWKTIETKHFLIHFYDGTDRSAKVISKIAEEIFEPITKLYNHEPNSKVSIVIKDFDDYSNGAAYFYDNKIEIFAPALDFDLRGTHNWLRNVVTHEFTHIIQMQCSMKFGRKFPAIYLQWLNYEEERRQDILYGYPNLIASYPISGFNVPSWFAEGVAQNNLPELNYDNWDSHRDMILRTRALNNNLLSWNEMSVFGKNSLGNESSYNAGFSLSKYIHEKYGQETIPKIARALANTSTLTMGGAVKNVLDKSGEDLFDEWKNFITENYKKRVSNIYKNINEGKIISNTGFGNFYPSFSKRGTKFAYSSTKENDYFSQSSLFVFDLEKKEETEIIKNVASSVSWSQDESKIYYSKITRDNKYFSEFSDIYFWDFTTEKETRLTFGLRASNPTLAPNEKRILFVINKDGTSNLGVFDVNGSNFKQLTQFQNGEFISLPKYSPDGEKVIFGFTSRNAQDIAEFNFIDSTFNILIGGSEDERHPTFSPDGKIIYYSSDKTGIYNLFKYEVESKKISQITNVFGGAFYPTINEKGKIIFSNYTNQGFVLSEIENFTETDYSQFSYLKEDEVLNSTNSEISKLDYLKNYNDLNLKSPLHKNYENVFTSMSIVPMFRFDNYNTTTAGLDNLKPGFYFSSSDVIDKYNLFGGASMNKLFERDLFLILEYRDKLPIIYQMGLNPTLSLEIFNVTRKNNAELELVRGGNKFPLNITYGLTEISMSLKHHIISEADLVTLKFTNSNYSVDISSFTIPGDAIHLPLLVPASTEKYYTAKNFSLQWEFYGIKKSTTMDINPVGRKLKIKFEKSLSQFNSSGTYEDQGGGNWVLLLDEYNIERGELFYKEHLKIPFTKQTLTFSLQAASILGKTINEDFYYYYAGGLIGMKGYPYYSIGGNEMAIASATYRFPIIEKMDLQLAHLQLEKLYGSFFYDFGNAWNGENNFKNWKRDFGAELRLEMFSFYSYPTRLFFNAAYGVDKVNFKNNNVDITYNPEWRFYIGLLFGFEIE